MPNFETNAQLIERKVKWAVTLGVDVLERQHIELGVDVSALGCLELLQEEIGRRVAEERREAGVKTPFDEETRDA